MAGKSRISELASLIQGHTAEIDKCLLRNALPSPSFDLDTTPIFPDAIQESQKAILEAADELSILIHGPLPYLMNLAVNQHTSLTSLQAIYRFNIATSFPTDEEASFAQISQRCGLNQDDTQRLLRHAMTYYIFREPREGIVAHTPASKVLAENPILRQWIGQATEDMWPAATRVVDAIAKWPGSEEPSQAGYNLANNTGDPMYIDINKNPIRAKRFADAMSLFYSRPGLEISHIVNNYDWVNTGNGTGGKTTVIVDVGGSHGTVSIELAKKFSSVECIVQDLPEVLLSAETPPELAGRVRFMAHDFFTKQPVKGADVYYFRWIFHNWSNKYAIRILQALIPALKHGARVIISEACIPDHGAISLYQERTVRTNDLAMKEAFNSKERSADDWAWLFQQADSRFKLQEIKTPPGSYLAMIIASWEGETSFPTA